MPITLKKDEWKVKDPSSGNYRGAAILSTTLPEDAAQIIEDTQNALDAEEVRAGQIINDAQNAVDGIEGQSSLIQQKVANAVLNGNNYELIDTAVESWLDAHPEATTTVKDHSLTYEKLVIGTLGYVTPEMFGAIGDGSADDTAYIQAAILFAQNVDLGGKTYLVSDTIYLQDGSNVYNGSIKADFQIGKLFKTVGTAGTHKSTVAIKNITFIGECYRVNDADGLVAIELNYTDNVLVDSCVFTGFNKNIEITNCENTTVISNVIKDATETATAINGYGVLLEGGENHKILNNVINAERHCVYINLANSIIVTGNEMYGQTDNLSSYSHYEGNIKLCGASKIEITNNLINGNYYGIGFTDTLGGGATTDSVIIQGNIIRGFIACPNFARGGIVTPEASTYKNISIINNDIYTDQAGTIRGISVDLGSWENLNIINNKCRGLSTGIRCTVDAFAVIDGNIVQDCTNGYDFATVSNIHASGTFNYYKNCTIVVDGNQYLKNIKMQGIIDISGQTKRVTSNTIDASIACEFYTGGADNFTVDGISGGFEGQIITFMSNAGGSFKIPTGLTRIYLAGDMAYTSGRKSAIAFKKVDNDWIELFRSTY